MTPRRPALFVELCAGTAALSLALQGGKKTRPPVSRMGAKTGYARAIAKVLGLRLGLGADAYLWVEPDPGMASVLRCYPDPVALQAVAERIKSWSTEDPRALWDRLRVEGKAEQGEDVAGYLYLWEGSYAVKGPDSGCAEEVLRGIPTRHNFGGFRPARDRILDKVEAIPLDWPPTEVIQAGAEGVDVDKVARWLASEALSRPGADGFRGLHKHRENMNGWYPQPQEIARRCAAFSAMEWPPTAVLQGTATEAKPPPLPLGVVVYHDGPYHGDGTRKITGYGHEYPREDQIKVCARWHKAGAVVCISECVSLRAEMKAATGDDWWDVDITGERVGQRRTFGGTMEWLTVNRPPAWRPKVQTTFF